MEPESRSAYDFVMSCAVVPLGRVSPSSSSSHRPAKLRTDLRLLEKWDDFREQMEITVQKLRRIPCSRVPRFTQANLVEEPLNVGSKGDVILHFLVYLHMQLMEMFDFLDNELGFFDCSSGVIPVLGDPDLVYVSDKWRTAKALMEVSPPWKLKDSSVRLEQAWPSIVQKEQNGTATAAYESVTSLYGYLCINNLRFGILNNAESTWMFQRTSALAVGGAGGVLQVEGPFRGRQDPCSLLVAFLTLLRLAEKDWLFDPLLPSGVAPSPRANLPPRALPSKSQLGMVLDENPHSIPFLRAKARSQFCIATGTHLGTTVIVKLVDKYKVPERAEALVKEREVYEELATLQGNLLPKLFAFVSWWDILWALVVEDVGTSLEAKVEDEGMEKDEAKRVAKVALKQLHAQNWLHGDVRASNFCVRDDNDGKGSWQCVIIDLGRARVASTDKEKDEELEEIDDWFDEEWTNQPEV